MIVRMSMTRRRSKSRSSKTYSGPILNALEEALGYEQLIADYGYTQNDLGEIIGKSRSHVANSLRLLKLPEPVRDLARGR